MKVYSSDKAYGLYPGPEALWDICTAWLGCSILIRVVGLHHKGHLLFKIDCNILYVCPDEWTYYDTIVYLYYPQSDTFRVDLCIAKRLVAFLTTLQQLVLLIVSFLT